MSSPSLQKTYDAFDVLKIWRRVRQYFRASDVCAAIILERDCSGCLQKVGAEQSIAHLRMRLVHITA